MAKRYKWQTKAWREKLRQNMINYHASLGHNVAPPPPPKPRNKPGPKPKPKPPPKGPRTWSIEERRALSQRLKANPLMKSLSPEQKVAHKLRTRAGVASSEKHKKAVEWLGMLWEDPVAHARMVKKTQATRREKGLGKKAKKTKKKKPARMMLSKLIPLDGSSKPRYDAVWVSPVDPDYSVKMKTLKVIKHGRPRDPWGNYMVPKYPEQLFGFPITNNGDPLVYPPTVPMQVSDAGPSGGTVLAGGAEDSQRDTPDGVGQNQRASLGLYHVNSARHKRTQS